MQQNFLSQMIQKGRLQYVLAQLLPNTPDSILMGYTKAQIEYGVKRVSFLFGNSLFKKTYLHKQTRIYH